MLIYLVCGSPAEAKKGKIKEGGSFLGLCVASYPKSAILAFLKTKHFFTKRYKLM